MKGKGNILATIEQDIQAFVFKTIESFGPNRERIERAATLESLDVDSLDLIELGQLVEERFGIRLLADDLNEVHTVGQAVDRIAEKVR